MFKRIDWKSRALAAEARLAELLPVLTEADERLAAVQAIIADRASLASIAVDGRTLRFIFVRNGETTVIETYATMDADVSAWKRALLPMEN